MQKIGRASEHLAELKARMQAWDLAYGIQALPQVNEDQTALSFFAHMAQPPPVAEWALVLGDAVHCVRSALDALAWELTHLNGRVPSNERQVAFPLDKKPAQFKNRRAHLDTVPGDVFARIEAVQPFHAPDPEHSLLALISDLDNQDKHRTTLSLRPSAFNIESRAIVNLQAGTVVRQVAPPGDMELGEGSFLGGIVTSLPMEGEVDGAAADVSFSFGVEHAGEYIEMVELTDSLLNSTQQLMQFILTGEVGDRLLLREPGTNSGADPI